MAITKSNYIVSVDLVTTGDEDLVTSFKAITDEATNFGGSVSKVIDSFDKQGKVVSKRISLIADDIRKATLIANAISGSKTPGITRTQQSSDIEKANVETTNAKLKQQAQQFSLLEKQKTSATKARISREISIIDNGLKAEETLTKAFNARKLTIEQNTANKRRNIIQEGLSAGTSKATVSKQLTLINNDEIRKIKELAREFRDTNTAINSVGNAAKRVFTELKSNARDSSSLIKQQNDSIRTGLTRINNERLAAERTLQSKLTVIRERARRGNLTPAQANTQINSEAANFEKINAELNKEEVSLRKQIILEKQRAKAIRGSALEAQKLITIARAQAKEEIQQTVNGLNKRKTLTARFNAERIAIEKRVINTINGLREQALKGTISKAILDKESLKLIDQAKAKIVSLGVTIEKTRNASLNFKNRTAKLVQQLEEEQNIEGRILKSGRNSIEAKRAEFDKQRLSSKRNLINNLNSLERRLEAGSTTVNRADRVRTGLLNKHKRLLEQINRQQEKSIRLTSRQVTIDDILIKKIAKFALGYRVVNSVIDQTLNLLRSIPKAGIDSQATQAALEGVFGSVNTKFIREELVNVANFTGQSIDVLEKGFRKFAASAKIAGVDLATVTQVFEDFAVVGTVLQKTSDEMDSIFIALDQIFSKGVAQSEELKRQLGNQLPAAVEIAAKSVGMLPGDFLAAMKRNEIIAKDFVPKFAALYRKIFSGDIDQVLLSLQDQLFVSYTRLLNEFTNFSRNTFTQVEGILVSVTNIATKTLRFVNDNFGTVATTVRILAKLIGVRLVLALTSYITSSIKSAKVSAVLAGRFATLGSSAGGAAAKVNVLTLSLTKLVTITKVAITALTGFKGRLAIAGIITAGSVAIGAFTAGLIKNKELLATNADQIALLRTRYEQYNDTLDQVRKGNTTLSKEQLEQLDKGLQRTKAQLAIAEKGLTKGKQLVVSFNNQEASLNNVLKVIGELLSAATSTVLRVAKVFLVEMGNVLKGIVLIAKGSLDIFGQTVNAFFTSLLTNLFAFSGTVKGVLVDLFSGDIKSFADLTKSIGQNFKIAQKEALTAINSIKSGTSEILSGLAASIKANQIDPITKAFDAIITEAQIKDIGDRLKIANAKNLIDEATTAENAKTKAIAKTNIELKSSIGLLKALQKANIAAFEAGTVPMKEFFADQEQFIRDIIALQVQSKQARLDAFIKKGLGLSVGDPEKAALFQESERLRNEIATLNAEKDTALIELSNRKTKAEQDFQNSLIQTRIELLKLQGNLVEAIKLEQELADRKPAAIRARTEAKADTPGAKTAIEERNRIRNNATEQAALNQFLAEKNLLDQEQQLIQQSLSRQRDQGLLNVIDFTIQASDATNNYKDNVANLFTEYDLLNIAATTTNKSLALQIEGLRQNAKIVASEFEKIGQKIKASLEGALANSFEQFITGAASAKEAMKDFVKQILREVAKLAAIELAKQLIGLAVSAASASSSVTTSGGIFNIGDTISTSGGQITGLSTAAASSSLSSANVAALGNIGSSLISNIGSAFNNKPNNNNGNNNLQISQIGTSLATGIVSGVSAGLTNRVLDSGINKSGVQINQTINITVESKDGESDAEQQQRLGQLFREQMLSIIDERILNATQVGNTLNPTQISA